MHKISSIKQGLCALAVLATATPLWAQAPGQPGHPVVNAQFHQVKATVQAIDPTTREMTLQGPRGPVNIQVDPGVKNLENVHVGDTVTVSYYEGIATQMSKGGKTVKSPATSTFALPSSSSAHPGGGFGSSMTTTVTIEAVNPVDHTVAFRGTDGRLRTVAVQSPNMRHFVRTLQPGDKVDVTYTESVAVNITPSSPGAHVAEGK